MSDPVASRWLPNDGYGVVFRDMADGYTYPDYPGEKTGPGRVADLEYEGQWIAQMWTDDKDGCDIILLQNYCKDLAFYTRAALFLRLMRHDGHSATEAFEYVLDDVFDTSVRTVSDLSTVTGEPGSGDTVAIKKQLPKK